MTIIEISPAQLADAILLCIATPMEGRPGEAGCLWGLTPNIIGEPGIAKTAINKKLCCEIANVPINEFLATLFASQHPPEDFSGALIPDGAGGAQQICPLGPVRKILKTGTGVIFLDEINGAPPATQAALQSFIHERRAGDEHMPGEVRIIAASNPEDIATAGHRLAPAVANRMVHIEYKGGTVQDWIDWNMGAGTQQQRLRLDDIEDKVASGWGTEFPKAQGLMNGFLNSHPARIHERPARNSKEAGRAWNSRRTLDFTQRAWATARIIGSDATVRDTVIEGCIGGAAATEFLEYAAKTGLPDPEDVLNGKWTPNSTRLDIVIGAYSSMTAYVLDKNRARDRWGGSPFGKELAAKAWEALASLLQLGLTDIVVPATKALGNAGLGRESSDKEIRDASGPIYLALDRMGVHKIV